MRASSFLILAKLNPRKKSFAHHSQQ